MRKWAIDQLGLILKNPKLPRESVWIKSIFEFIIINGFFKIEKTIRNHKNACPEVSTSVQKYCQERLFSAVEELGSLSLELKGFYFFIISDGEKISYLEYSTRFIRDSTSNGLTPINDFPEKVQQLFIKSDSKLVDDARFNSYQLLINVVSLFVYSDPLSDWVSTLEELIDLQPRIFVVKNKKRKKSVEVDELSPYDVLVDLLVGLLSKPSSLLRKICGSVFEKFSGNVTLEGLNVIIKVLESGEEGLENGDDNESEFDSDGDLDSDGSISEEDSESELESEDQVESDIIQKNTESNQDESEDEGLNDDDMAEFDEKLVEIFKEKKRIKQEKKCKPI